MAESLAVSITTPIASVSTVADSDGVPAANSEGAIDSAALQAERELLMRAGQSLEQAAVNLQQFQEEIFSSHKEQIARLSIEIAGKILQKEIGDGKYDIGKIIAEALKAAPSQEDVVVYLNADDLARYEKELKGKKDEDVAGHVKLAAGANVGPGECIVETDKGMIEYFIAEHLKKVSEALKITE
ncbi:MAG: FliH/SctL family protein [Planctomycetota bacterium]|jgi:flagellar biosynthesis/type III secretory pathway protein FliH